MFNFSGSDADGSVGQSDCVTHRHTLMYMYNVSARTMWTAGVYLVLVLHQVAQDVVWVQDPPVTVLHMVCPNQEIPFLQNKSHQNIIIN